MKLVFDVPTFPVHELHRRLGFGPPLDYPQASLNMPLTAWRMEDDDSPIGFAMLAATPHDAIAESAGF